MTDQAKRRLVDAVKKSKGASERRVLSIAGSSMAKLTQGYIEPPSPTPRRPKGSEIALDPVKDSPSYVQIATACFISQGIWTTFTHSKRSITLTDNTPGNDLTRLRDLVRQFVEERDWDQFHTPKNLSAALCVEAAELLEHFQWLPTGEKSTLGKAKIKEISLEMADVMVYLIRLADKLDVDLATAVTEKMVLNRLKYPAEKVKGDARKYTAYTKE